MKRVNSWNVWNALPGRIAPMKFWPRYKTLGVLTLALILSGCGTKPQTLSQTALQTALEAERARLRIPSYLLVKCPDTKPVPDGSPARAFPVLIADAAAHELCRRRNNRLVEEIIRKQERQP